MVETVGLSAVAFGRHLGPGGMVGEGAALIVIFGVWLLWPNSVVRLNDWLAKFRWARALARMRTPPGESPRPTNRRIRIVASIGVAVGIALLVTGLVRLRG